MDTKLERELAEAKRNLYRLLAKKPKEEWSGSDFELSFQLVSDEEMDTSLGNLSLTQITDSEASSKSIPDNTSCITWQMVYENVVEDALRDADLKSEAYKAGMVAGMRFTNERTTVVFLYPINTADGEAFAAGVEYGKAAWQTITNDS